MGRKRQFRDPHPRAALSAERSSVQTAAKVCNPPTADEGLTGRNVSKGREIAIFN